MAGCDLTQTGPAVVHTPRAIARLARLVRSPREVFAYHLGRRVVNARLRAVALVYGLPSIELASLADTTIEIAPPILDDICMPPYFGVPGHDDYTPLLQIARTRAVRLIVELGTAHGNTTANLCRELPGCAVYTVNATADIQTGTGTTFSLAAADIGRVYRQHGFADQVTQILANTLHLDLSSHLELSSVDLAIVDACHDTEYVVNDFLKLVPYVARGGLVVLHDTHPSMAGHLRTSYQACMSLRRAGFDVRYLQGTWWAIWSPHWPDARARTPAVLGGKRSSHSV